MIKSTLVLQLLKDKIKTSILFNEIILLLLQFSLKINNKKNNKFKRNKNKNIKSPIHKNIAFIHSKVHYNPDFHDVDNKYFNSGTAIWCRWFLLNLKKYNVRYFDIHDKVSLGDKNKFDFIIGIVSPIFLKLSSINPNAKVILIAVNSHPVFTLQQIIKDAKYFNVKIPIHEFKNPVRHMQCINRADEVLLTGNDFIKSTFTENGKEDSKIHTIYLKIMDEAYPYLAKMESSELVICYPSGGLGLRKGILRLLENYNELKINCRKKISLKLMGNCDPEINEAIEKYINLDSSITKKGFGTHDEVLQHYYESDIVILLSLEEGQVSSVLEAISCGCIPLISKNCGIDLPTQFIVNDPRNKIEVQEKFVNIIKNLKEYKKSHLSLIKFIENNIHINNPERKLINLIENFNED